MTTRKLAGAKHDRCIGHVAHPYPKSGKLCIGATIGEAGMVAFADLMAEKAAEHRAAFLAEPWPAPSAKARKVRVSPMPCADSVTRGSAVTLPELVERYRLMRGGEPAADSYIGAVARAHSRKARAPKVVGPVAVEVDGTVVAVTRHVEITEPAAPEPDEIEPRCDICGEPKDHEPGIEYDWNGETGCHLSCEASPQPVAEPSRCWQYLHTQGGTRRCMVQPDLHDGAHDYESTITPIGPTPAAYAALRAEAAARHAAENAAADPETATEPVAEPEPIRSTPTLAAVPTSGRPTCPRCGQSFRKSGIGLAWHVANRPDCAAGRLAVA